MMAEEPKMANDAEKDDDGEPMDKYRIENAMRTLEEAEQIKGNKKLMSALKPHVKKRQKRVASLADLVKVRDKLKAEGR